MPLFQIDQKRLQVVKPSNFAVEKDLQALIENSLQSVFNCRFIDSEFPTGTQHAGRIDTLALSEDNNPVIIEYKKVESSELINQSLYYLSWIHDHRGDFQVAASRKLGNDVEIDWSDVRVICIAPGYKKYDLHAVQVMGANIELWQYRLFANGSFYLEEVFRRAATLAVGSGTDVLAKDPVMVAAGKKAAITRVSGSYTFEQHLDGASAHIREIVVGLQQFIMSLDESIEESPKKFYIAYKVTQNFVCIEVKRRSVTLFLKLDPTEHMPLPPNARDVRNIGHYGTGDLEITIQSKEEIEPACKLVRAAFDRVGG
jgi:predicted transport protein